MLQLYRFTATVPAGTAKTAPLTFDASFPPREVVEIEILVPPGPRGEVGFKIAQAGVQVIPAVAGDFIVTDNETIHWPIEGANTSGAWQVIAYNTGAFNHSLEVRFQVNLPGAQAAAAAGGAGPQPIAPADLSLSVDGGPPPDTLSLPDPGALPASAPPGVPSAPGPPGVPGPQAPPPVNLPSAPPLPAAPRLGLGTVSDNTLDAIEAAGQAALEGSAAAANAEALADRLEAIGQAAHEAAKAGAEAPPSPDPGALIIL